MFAQLNFVTRPLTFVPRTSTRPPFIKFFHSLQTPQLLEIIRTQGLKLGLNKIGELPNVSERQWVYLAVSEDLVKKGKLNPAEKMVVPCMEKGYLRDAALSSLSRGWLKYQKTTKAASTVQKIEQTFQKEIALMSVCAALAENGKMKKALKLASKNSSLIKQIFQKYFETHGLVETIRCFNTVEIHEIFSDRLFDINRNDVPAKASCGTIRGLIAVEEIVGKNEKDRADRKDYARLQILYNACTEEALKILPQISNLKLRDHGSYHLAIRLCADIDRQSEAVTLGNSITDIVLREQLFRATHSVISEQNSRTKSLRSLGIRRVHQLEWNEKGNEIKFPYYPTDEMSIHREIVMEQKEDEQYREYWKNLPPCKEPVY